MKVDMQKLKEVHRFQPFDLNITIESQEEAQAIYAIFNHTRNSDLLPTLSSAITEQLNDFYVTKGIIANGVTYKEFYK